MSLGLMQSHHSSNSIYPVPVQRFYRTATYSLHFLESVASLLKVSFHVIIDQPLFLSCPLRLSSINFQTLYNVAQLLSQTVTVRLVNRKKNCLNRSKYDQPQNVQAVEDVHHHDLRGCNSRSLLVMKQQNKQL